MAKFKNVSPLGALDLPLIGRVVDRGEVITVTAAQAKHLRGQDATWEPVRSGNSSSGQTPPNPDPDGGEQPAADQQSEE